jgi:L-fuconolactonase
VVASLPNTMAKFSGLHLPGVPFDEATVGGLLDLALDAFGADRLMYGGDWPMSVPHGGYLPTWQVMRACVDRLAPAERDAVLGGTAERCYLDPEIRPIVPESGRSARIIDESARNIG